MLTPSNLQKLDQSVKQFVDGFDRIIGPHVPQIIMFFRLPESEQIKIMAKAFIKQQQDEIDETRRANREYAWENIDLRVENQILRDDTKTDS